MTPVLDDRSLNRALLDRQLLLRRVRRPALDAVEHLVGLQAQEPQDPYVGLWSRLAGFDPDELSDALADRAAVRIALQRSTIHLVTAADCLALRPVLQGVGERMARGQFGRQLAGVEPGELAAAARELVDARAADLRRAGPAAGRAVAGPGAAAAGADRAGAAAAGAGAAARGVGARRPGPARHRRVLAGPPGRPRRRARPDGAALPGRVRAGHGGGRAELVGPDPAGRGGGAAGARGWCRSAAEDGRVLHDLPDAPRPGPDVPAPVRFLPQYDNVLLGHADRSRIASSTAAASCGTRSTTGRRCWWTGWCAGCGGWPGSAAGRRCSPGRRGCRRPTGRRSRREGTGLLAFLAAAAGTREVRMV